MNNTGFSSKRALDEQEEPASKRIFANNPAQLAAEPTSAASANNRGRSAPRGHPSTRGGRGWRGRGNGNRDRLLQPYPEEQHGVSQSLPPKFGSNNFAPQPYQQHNINPSTRGAGPTRVSSLVANANPRIVERLDLVVNYVDSSDGNTVTHVNAINRDKGDTNNVLASVMSCPNGTWAGIASVKQPGSIIYAIDSATRHCELDEQAAWFVVGPMEKRPQDRRNYDELFVASLPYTDTSPIHVNMKHSGALAKGAARAGSGNINMEDTDDRLAGNDVDALQVQRLEAELLRAQAKLEVAGAKEIELGERVRWEVESRRAEAAALRAAESRIDQLEKELALSQTALEQSKLQETRLQEELDKCRSESALWSKKFSEVVEATSAFTNRMSNLQFLHRME